MRSETSLTRPTFGLRALFAATTFLSAYLLFQVQPMATKPLLPLLGGAPAVWVTAVLLFQAVLLAGYAYAHLLVMRARPIAQVVLYAAPALAGLAILQLDPARGWVPPTETSPQLWLMARLLLTVGPAFFALAATSPLLQSWFHSVQKHGEPYRLYAVSNAGSLMGLLAYPLIVEPLLTLPQQEAMWAVLFLVFGLLAGACSVALFRSGAGAEEDAAGPITLVDRSTKLLWFGLAFVPSSLVLGVTTHITTDVAAVPLLWVVPLALYLVSFVIAFGPRQVKATETASRSLPLLCVAVLAALALGSTGSVFVLILVDLAAFFAAALVCHGRLASLRPPPRRLTGYLLLVAVGGAAGGLFNALVAPFLFDWPLEYPIALVLAAALRPRPQPEDKRWSVAGAVPLVALVAVNVGDGEAVTLLAIVCLPALLLVLVAARPKLFAVAFSVLALTLIAGIRTRGEVLFDERNFYGPHRVVSQEGFHELIHGTTNHGSQSKAPGEGCEPTSYYHPTGPSGELLTSFAQSHEEASLAVIGLGSGAMKAFGRPGHEFTFYEIDPLMEQIAEDPRLFTYLGCPGTHTILLGDGRISIADAPDASFDVIAMDAFSSDAVPVHLLTEEAFDIYAAKLAPGGILVTNVTNRYLDLAPVVAAGTEHIGFRAFVRHDRDVGSVEEAEGKLPSRWIVAAEDPQTLESLVDLGAWEPLAASGQRWTDDFSNLIGLLWSG